MGIMLTCWLLFWYETGDPPLKSINSTHDSPIRCHGPPPNKKMHLPLGKVCILYFQRVSSLNIPIQGIYKVSFSQVSMYILYKIAFPGRKHSKIVYPGQRMKSLKFSILRCNIPAKTDSSQSFPAKNEDCYSPDT